MSKEADYQALDRAAEEAARSKQAATEPTIQREKKRLAGALMFLLPKRDQEVLRWICDVTGQTAGDIVLQMVRQKIIAERSNHREYLGGGGSSSKDLEKLSERLPGKR